MLAKDNETGIQVGTSLLPVSDGVLVGGNFSGTWSLGQTLPRTNSLLPVKEMRIKNLIPSLPGMMNLAI